ncbi:MAG: accessory factor UbiK family protein [Agitococcus sp.]|nr:accessory factor UbiK family protein [Agitococcus sp.]
MQIIVFFIVLVRFLGEVSAMLDNLVQKVREQVRERYMQSNQSGLWHELDKNLQAVLQETFAKMELVNREEFDRQTVLLSEARQKLTALQAQMKALEQQLK